MRVLTILSFDFELVGFQVIGKTVHYFLHVIDKNSCKKTMIVQEDQQTEDGRSFYIWGASECQDFIVCCHFVCCQFVCCQLFVVKNCLLSFLKENCLQQIHLAISALVFDISELNH